MRRVRLFPAITLFILGAATAEILLNFYTGEVYDRRGYVIAMILLWIATTWVFVRLVRRG